MNISRLNNNNISTFDITNIDNSNLFFCGKEEKYMRYGQLIRGKFYVIRVTNDIEFEDLRKINHINDDEFIRLSLECVTIDSKYLKYIEKSPA